MTDLDTGAGTPSLQDLSDDELIGRADWAWRRSMVLGADPAIAMGSQWAEYRRWDAEHCACLAELRRRGLDDGGAA